MAENEYHFLSKLNEISPILTEQDIDRYVADRVYEELTPYIEYLARKTISTKYLDNLNLLSFKESSKGEIKNSLYTYLFKSKLWQEGRDPVPYIKLCLKRMATSISNDRRGIKTSLVMVCPLCITNDEKIYLKSPISGSLWECPKCSENIEIYQEKLKKAIADKDQQLVAEIQSNLRCSLAFKSHSRKGYCCPDCKRFIPHSAGNEFGISCPYPDCFFFGDPNSLELMNHPLGVGRSTPFILSMDAALSNSNSDGPKVADILGGSIETIKNQILQDDYLQIKQESEKEFLILIESIDELITFTKKQSTSATKKQKVLMLEAYKNLCKKFPEDMISYLVHRKQSSETPLQSKIFQEYVSLIENALPFYIKKGKNQNLILSLTDENLNLFLGQSQFESVVGLNGVIPNETKEIDTGDRTYKHHGPCFIGKIIDVIDLENNKSILSEVRDYSFVGINLNERVRAGTRVRVSHFRIPPHYETMGLVFLQRMRRQIVDKVFYKLNKKKRVSK